MREIFKELKNDLPASIVVFFVAVPLCLGIALASGAPLFAGIIAGIIGGIVVGIASGSPLGVSGPAAGLAVIVLTSIGTLGGSWEAFLMAVVLAGIYPTYTRVCQGRFHCLFLSVFCNKRYANWDWTFNNVKANPSCTRLGQRHLR